MLHGPKDPPFWKDRIVKPEEVLERIRPGMTIFLGTGMAEPRTLVRQLMASDRGNLQDLELIQLVSLGDTVSIDERYSKKYRHAGIVEVIDREDPKYIEPLKLFWKD